MICRSRRLRFVEGELAREGEGDIIR